MNSHWTSSEIESLRRYIDSTTPSNRSPAEAAGLVGRSSYAVQIKANRMGLKFSSFSEAESDLIREWYSKLDGGIFSLSSLGRRLGRTPSTIATFARKLGLTDKSRAKPYLKGRFKIDQWQNNLKHLDSYRGRARRLFAELGNCELCGKPAFDRHHVDNDPKNNEPGNVQKLCRRCHMLVDGRLFRIGQIRRTPRPPRPCENCGLPSKPLAKGRCMTCYAYWRRTGRDR